MSLRYAKKRRSGLVTLLVLLVSFLSILSPAAKAEPTSGSSDDFQATEIACGGVFPAIAERRGACHCITFCISRCTTE